MIGPVYCDAPAQNLVFRYGERRLLTGSGKRSMAVMLIVNGCTGPAHERFAAAAKRVDKRITQALKRGDYLRVRELSVRLQELTRRAIAEQPR